MINNRFQLRQNYRINFPGQDHNCIRELRAVTNKQKQKISELELELQGHSYQIANLRREIQVLKVNILLLYVITSILEQRSSLHIIFFYLLLKIILHRILCTFLCLNLK